MGSPAAPRIGIRHILGLDSLHPAPQYYITRSSRRLPSVLTPKGGHESFPFAAPLYGNDCQLVMQKQVKKGDGGEKAKAKDEPPKGETTKGNGNNKAGSKNRKNGKQAKEKTEDANGKQDGNGGAKDNNAKADDKPKDASAKDSAAFTKEEDEELIKLKNENTSWAAISASMGKPVQAVKTRFGEIKPKDWRPPKQGKEAQKEANDKVQKAGADGDKKDGGGDAQAGGEAAKEQPAAKEAAADRDDMTSIYEFEGKQYKRRRADGRFPTEVLQYAGEFDDRWYWVNMSSRLFDKFGQRYSPEELKAKMGG